MSHSLRFLGLAVTAWVGVRAISLGMIPGLGALAFDKAEAATTSPGQPAATALPPVEPTELAPPPPIQQAALPYPPYGYGYPPPYAYAPAAYPAYYAPRIVAPTSFAPSRRSSAPRYAMLEDIPGLPYRSSYGAADEWPMIRAASTAGGRSVPQAIAAARPPRFDRWQVAAWAMLRDRPGPSSLAANGTLGGSQAGSRILYRFNNRLAASLRFSAPVNSATRGGEVALGVRYQPFASIPVALTAERRQAFGRGAGQSNFALFAEGGVWQRPIAARFALDAYLQGGLVGPKGRAAFVDGSATLTRPVYRNISAGLGTWGGVQPGLKRLDVGPRVSMKVGRSMRAHLDYRYRAFGNAEPGSGAVVTIAGDF